MKVRQTQKRDERNEGASGAPRSPRRRRRHEPPARLAVARSRALDVEWDARARVLSFVPVLLLAQKPNEIGQYTLDDLREAWAEYDRASRDRQEL